MRIRAREVEYLVWFRLHANFGAATSDVIDAMNQKFMEESGKNLPEGWNYASDDKTNLDQE